VIVSIVGQSLIFYLLRKKDTIFKISRTKPIFAIQILLILAVTINGILFSLLIVQILEVNAYNTDIFKIIIFTNYFVSLISLSFLIQHLFSWVKRAKNLVMIVYLVSFSVFILNEISSILILYFQFDNRAAKISFISNPWDSISLKILTYTDIYKLTSIASFSISWIATCLLLYHYSRKIGKWKFWLLAGLPLIYYVGNIDLIRSVIFGYIVSINPSALLTLQFFLGGAKQIGGFFFALVFIIISMKVDGEKLKYYLLISATGIMLLFSSNQISLVQVIPYPPFGLVTISLLSISSFLVLVGLRNLASSMAFDKKMLENARKIVREKASTFLYDIGSAEWQKEMDRTIPLIIDRNSQQMEDSSVPTSLSADEVRSYIDEISKELMKVQGRKD
jgi:hypothetical protein